MSWIRGQGWEKDKALLDEWYNKYWGRPMSEEEWRRWEGAGNKRGVNDAWESIISAEASKYRASNPTPGAGQPTATPTIDKTNKNYQKINTLYKVNLGREISDNEWLKYYEPKQNESASWDELVANSEEAKTFKNKVALGEDKSYVDKQKPPEPTPGETADTTTNWIKELYASMQPQIEQGVKSAAGQRGGLDTGGYLTSMGKAKAGTWQQMLQAIIGQSNTDRTFKENVRQFDVTQQNLNKGQAAQYDISTAQLKAQEPSPWQYILSGAAAGGTVGGWPGAIIGGLAGWGSKQGFFG